MDRRDFLEISPYQTDEGELIGKHPGEVPSEILSLKFRAQKPLEAIRQRCLDCCCGNASEVRKCTAIDCPSWPFRMGTNPFRQKRSLSAEQKAELVERLAQARDQQTVQNNEPPKAGAVSGSKHKRFSK
jgi:hypothetical protein